MQGNRRKHKHVYFDDALRTWGNDFKFKRIQIRSLSVVLFYISTFDCTKYITNIFLSILILSIGVYYYVCYAKEYFN